LAERVSEWRGAVALAAERHVDAPQVEGQAFAEVAEDDLEARVGFEHAGQDQPDSLGRGLDAEAPGRGHQAGELLDVVLVVGLDHGLVRYGGMDVERDVERLRALEDRPEALVVEEEMRTVHRGEAVHHRALEVELGHRALELVGGRLRVRGRQHGEAFEPALVLLDGLMQPVVGALRERHRGRGVDALRGGRAVRHDLQVVAGFVHFLEAEFAEVVEAPVHLGVAHLRAADLVMGRDLGVAVVFFERAYFHGQITPLHGVGYRVEGRGNRWVTLVTGIANDLTMWDGQMPVLEPRCKVLRYDLRGHGGTWATAGEYTIDLLVQDLAELLDSQKVQRTALVGLGLGGAIAQAFAIRHPARVERLMPCCCRAQMVPDFAAMWHKLRDTVRENGLESIVEQTVQRWFSEDFKAAHPEVLDKVRAMIRRTTF